MSAKGCADVTGVVLAGGLGRRMGGVDKGLVAFRGAPMVAAVIERLAPQVGEQTAFYPTTHLPFRESGSTGVAVFIDAVVREFRTEADGSFVIFPLNPSVYSVTVEMTGFKKAERKEIKLFANDRVALPPIILEVGAATETIEVRSEAVQLQTQSAERSGITP